MPCVRTVSNRRSRSMAMLCGAAACVSCVKARDDRPLAPPLHARAATLEDVGRRFVGRVLSDGRPVTLYGVTVVTNMAAGNFPPATRVSALDGQFHSRAYEPGLYDIIISAPGFERRVILGARLEQGSSTDLGDIHVRRARMVSGRVVDTNGHGIASARIEIRQRDSHETRRDILTELARGNATATADEQGLFVIQNTATTYPLDGTPLIFATDAESASGPYRLGKSMSHIDLVMRPVGSIEGTVHVSMAGTMVSEVVIVRPKTGDDPTFSVVPNPAGDFKLPEIPEGDYVVLVIGAQRTAKPITVVAGQTAFVTL